MSKVNIIVSDECPVFRDATVGILQKYCPEYTTHKASSEGEVLLLLHQHSIDLIFLELKVPILKSFDSIRLLKSANPGVKIVVVSMISQGSIIQKLFTDGIDGYIFKGTNWSNLLSVVQLINSGNMYISPELFLQFNEESGKVEITDEKKAASSLLTKNEKRLIVYLCQQLGTQEISQKLEIDENKIEQLKFDTMKKTKTKNIIGLALYAIQHGLIQNKNTIINS